MSGLGKPTGQPKGQAGQVDRLSNLEHWLAANRERIWTMQHEGDYTDGDTIINVALNENGNVSVVIVPTDPDPGAVCLTDEERERILWWLHKPVPPGPMKALDERIIRKLNGAGGQ